MSPTTAESQVEVTCGIDAVVVGVLVGKAVDETADLEHSLGGTGKSGDDETSIMFGQQVRGADDAAKPSRVEERHVGEIERHELRTERKDLVERIIERPRGGYVDLAGDCQQPGVGVVDALLS